MQARIRKAGLPDVEPLIGLFLEFNAFEETLDPEFKALDGRKAGAFKRYVEKCVKGKSEEFVLVAEKQGAGNKVNVLYAGHRLCCSKNSKTTQQTKKKTCS